MTKAKPIMADLRSTRGAGAPTLVLMLLAFLAIGGFMYWLNISSAATAVEVVETPDEPTAAAGGMAFAEFAADPSAFSGQAISVNGVAVASVMGANAFWTELSQNAPFLIRLNPSLSMSVAQGDVLSVTGTVVSMSDSILDAWTADGSFTNDTQRLEAEFAETFFEATAATR